MLHDIVFFLWAVFLDEDFGRHQEGDGKDGVDQGLWMARVNILLRLGGDLLEHLSWLEGSVSRIRESGRRTGNHARHPSVTLCGHVVNRFRGAQTMSPETDPVI